MLNYIRRIQQRRAHETGASAVEYGLLVALIAAVIVVAVIALGNLVNNSFSSTCTSIHDKATTAGAALTEDCS